MAVGGIVLLGGDVLPVAGDELAGTCWLPVAKMLSVKFSFSFSFSFSQESSSSDSTRALRRRGSKALRLSSLSESTLISTGSKLVLLNLTEFL